MKRLFTAIFCLASITSFLPQNCLAQGADEPASRDDVILYLRTMHSHDLMRRTLEVQTESMHALYRDMILKEKGKVPPGFDNRFKKEMDELIQGLPADDIVQAMIPAYQKHFTKSEIQAMNTFYSSPVGQKVLQELPAVLQEGNQAALPIMSKYLSERKERIKHDLEQTKETPEGEKIPVTVVPN